MVDRWVVIDNKSGTPEPEGYASEKDAWRHMCELARAQDRSPYEWTAYKVSFEVR